MAEQNSSNYRDIVGLIERTDAARQISIIGETLKTAHEYQAREQQASFEHIIGTESLLLAERMRWLYKHNNLRKLLPRILGGSAIAMQGRVTQPQGYAVGYGDMRPAPDTIFSPLLLLSKEPEEFSEDPGAVTKLSFRDGYQFSTGVEPFRNTTTVGISHYYIEEGTGEFVEINKDHFSVKVTGSNSDVQSVKVSGSKFVQQDIELFGQLVDAYYAQDNEKYNELQTSDSTYPDEFYYMPLGLVMQARNELGR